MMKVAKITAEKAMELKGELFSPNRKFNPVQDKNENWVVSLEESAVLSQTDFEVIDFEQKEELTEHE